MTARVAGLVSVVLVNFRGADDTVTCLSHVRSVDWPDELLEIICVENGSGDDSAARIRSADPRVILLESKENLGFAGACNLGARRSKGEYVAFLNNDARPDPPWIRAAVDAFGQAADIGSVASKVMNWDGTLVDFVDGAVTWFGFGYKPYCGAPDPGDFDEPRDVLFGTGAAVFFRADVFESAGGFDDRYFMFFEDVDLGWRLNLLGWRVRYEPRSLVFHRHHASVDKFGSFRETYLLERNALFTMYKNLDDDSLGRLLPGALLLAVRRAVARGDLDSTELDLRTPGDDSIHERPVSKETLAGIYAIDQFVEQITSLTASRHDLQRRRLVTDSSMRALFGRQLEPAYPIPSYLDGHQDIVKALGIEDPVRQKRILVITGEPVSTVMAGPAIRAWHMADHLSREHEVRLLTFGKAGVTPKAFQVLSVAPLDPHAVDVHVDWCDVIVLQGHAMALYPAIRDTGKVVVVDLYDPMHLEQLEQARERGPSIWAREVESATEVLNQQIARGDFFLCASDRQRHFWLGQFAALGRLNPLTYGADASMQRLLAVVPFGLPSQDPVRSAPGLRGVMPGIGATDKIIIWAGGLYNWLDPLTLIGAVDLLRRSRLSVRLVFLGVRHPNPAVPQMIMADRARELSEALGLTGVHVFFNEEWVPYGERQNYLLDADVGVSTHVEHLETTFSFRTRILDYLWAGLPIVTTEGDGFGDLVGDQALGVAVPANDPQALAQALELMLFDSDAGALARTNVQHIRQQFTWDRTLAPLIEFCRDPRPAPDRVPPESPDRKQASTAQTLGARMRTDIATARRYLATDGVGALASAMSARVRRQRAARRRSALR